MIKIVGIAIVAVLVLIGVVALWGTRLPVAHVATRAIGLPVAPDTLFAVIRDVAQAPGWRSGLTRVEIGRTGVNGVERFTEVSGGDRITMEVEDLRAPERLVTRIVDNRAFGGAWAFRVTPTGSGSRLTISEHGEVYNPIFRFVSAKVMGHTATLDKYLVDLARKFGSTATPEDGEVVPRRT